MNGTSELPNVSREQFRVPRNADLARATPSTHPPRILLLYGSLRQRSYSRLLAEEAARLLNAMGAETRFFNPAGLPLPDETPDSHPKVRELRELAHWAEGMVWSSPERHGAMSAVMKAQIDWIPLSVGSVRPTQGKTLALMQVCGGSQSFNALNQMRVLGRWMRMITIPNQSSVAKAYQEFDDAGRMKPSSFYDRVVDVMEELLKFTLLTRDVSAHLVDRYSERKEHAATQTQREAMSRGTNDQVDRVASLVAAPSSQRTEKRSAVSTPPAHRSDEISKSTVACCGGPAKNMAEACCVKDEEAKAAGHASCGCSQERSSVGSKQACCR